MRTAWVFPGQGSQYVGMGKLLAAKFERARDVFERADAALVSPISPICFEGPDSELILTANTQPAIVATSLAVLAVLRDRVGALPVPHFAAGHSLGEYSALVASGALQLEDAVALVRARGQAMQEAVAPGTGAMAAIMGIEAGALAAICERAEEGNRQVVSAANFNAPGQIVIAGHSEAVARASKLVAAEGGKAIPLKVSAPFHCSLMRSAAEAVEARLGSIQAGPMAFPVVANVDARPNRDPLRIKELLVQQVDHPVRWEQTVRLFSEEGVTHVLEIGPGKVLAGLIRRIAKDIQVLSIGDEEGIEAAARLFARSGPSNGPEGSPWAGSDHFRNA